MNDLSSILYYSKVDRNYSSKSKRKSRNGEWVKCKERKPFFTIFTKFLTSITSVTSVASAIPIPTTLVTSVSRASAATVTYFCYLGFSEGGQQK